MATSRLEQWKTQREQLAARIRAAEARAKHKGRKDENKRKFLIGAMVLDWMQTDEEMKRIVATRMERFLTRNSDRRLFDLEMLPEAKKAPGKKVKGRPGDSAKSANEAASDGVDAEVQ